MNYLAHLYLSGNTQEVIVGNMMEDYIHGRIEHPRNNHLNHTLKIGVQLHRNIDVFTDSHPIIKESKSFFHANFDRYAPIIIDVLFDHYLLINWVKYSAEENQSFRKRIYEAFTNHYTILPPKMQLLIESMITHDWLKNYKEIWGLERALMNISNRLSHKVDLTKAIPVFLANYEAIGKHFEDFFPQMIEHCDNFLIENNVEKISRSI